MEFFPIAGDPAELMEFMVENQLKSVQGFTNKITKHMEWVQNLCTTSWKACTTSLDDSLFRADVIMANPPSFVGFHIAEKLSIPLIMSFTMPWTATQEFPSPFVRTSGPRKNFLSYMALDRVIWLGIRSIINKWRETDLNLPPVRTKNFSGHRILYDLKVPYIYCFSEQLLPKPLDWGEWIGVSGFYFLDTQNNYDPPAELAEFLAAGEPPVFIGFGSIVVADPDALTECVMKAIELAGCRAIVQQGWAGMKPKNVPDSVLLLGPAPHDWLFERCAAVVHHGGAGTTATGLRAGKPTVVVPFFGDQFFWGNTVARMRLGPEPVLHSTITSEALAEGITFALQDEIKENAKQCGIDMRKENGVQKGIHLLKKYLPVDRMRCDTCPRNVPEYHCTNCELNLCATCNSVIHTCTADLSAHDQTDYAIINWGKHAKWWGPTVNAFADGGSAFSSTVGSGVVQAVNHVSDGQGVTGKVAGLGKGLFSVASGVAVGATTGVSTTFKAAQSPTYGSPVLTPPTPKRLALQTSSSESVMYIDKVQAAKILRTFCEKTGQTLPDELLIQ